MPSAKSSVYITRLYGWLAMVIRWLKRVLAAQIERASKPLPKPSSTTLPQEPIEIGIIEAQAGDYSLK